MRASTLTRIVAVLILMAACGGEQDRPDLFVDVRTDVRPGHEFEVVRVDLVGAGSAGVGRVERPATADEEVAYLEGVRVAEYENVDRPRAQVRVALLDRSGVQILDRTASVRFGESDRIVTIVLTRDCAGVRCPGAGDDPSLVACLGGKCVDPRCTPETPEHCPMGCTEDPECAVMADCAMGRCDHGTCFRVEREEACDETEWCHPEMGCKALPDVLDASMSVDGGMDGSLDGGTDASMSSDSGADAPLDSGGDAPMCGDGVCNGTEDSCSCSVDCGTSGCGPWGTPVRLDVLSDPVDAEDDPTLTGDLLEIYFNLYYTDGGFDELWRSTRADASDPWSTPEPVTEINSLYTTTNADISPDGLTLYFSRVVSGSSYDIFVTTRPTRSDPWGTPSPATGLNTADGELDGAVDSSGTHIVLQWRHGAGEWDICEAVRNSSSDPWGTPAVIPSLAPYAYNEGPFLTASGLEIYFRTSSSPSGIWFATRPALDQPFGAPSPVSDLEEPSTNSDPWVSPDGHLMVYASGRAGSRDLYEVTR